MLCHLQKDGSWLIEERLDEFLRQWKLTARDARVVLEDRRPAIRTHTDPVTYLTIHPYVWDLVKQKLKETLRGTPPPPRTRRCEGCGGELKVTREYEQVWVFACDRCKSVETHGKNLVGGSVGAGEKEKL